MNRTVESKVRKEKLFALFIYALSVLALFIYLYGFFPLKYSTNISKNRHNDKVSEKRYIDKLAFVVIDALRHDFVMPENDLMYMPFTMSSIINNEACYVVTKAHSPTVTLPRLKAITSGSISTYIDVVLNFMTPAFKEDNFISSAVSNGLKAVFYGDETWLKLFPNSFIRSEGTNSFFTYDYFEVDNNVTRHIADELGRNDWDIIILHYLGLDHIGHTEGPSSPLIKPKLFEMDNIVRKLSDHFKKLEEEEDLRTMLIVTGDHGMKDSGGHGGVTHPEVAVPLVSLGHSCVTLPGWPEDHIPFQVDIAPTLSFLLGLPIPSSNMGKIIPALLHNMPIKEILKIFETNLLELEKHSSNEGTKTNAFKKVLDSWLVNDQKDEELEKNITKEYFKHLDKLSRELVTSNSDFNLVFLISAVIVLWILMFLLFIEFTKQCPRPRRWVHWFFFIGTIKHAFSLVASSFIEEEHQTWYFFWATFCVLAFLEALYFTKNSSALRKVKFLIPWLILGAIHRVLRKLNQTGDKWAALPDIKFYLHSEEGQSWLFCIFLCGLIMIFGYAFLEKCPPSQLIVYGISLVTVLLYRMNTGNFKIQYFSYAASRGLMEVYAFWIFLILFTIQSAWNKTPFYLVWILFSSLFQRPHNVILLPIQVFYSKELHELFCRPQDVVWNALGHIWLGNVFYFYQGNGNSLSNVDVAAGFIGVKTYDPLYAGLMIASNTFNSHILSFILSSKVTVVFALLRVIPLTLYSTTLLFHLHHLFIWSVFSPKLLFESSITLTLFLIMVVHHGLYFWKSVHR